MHPYEAPETRRVLGKSGSDAESKQKAHGSAAAVPSSAQFQLGALLVTGSVLTSVPQSEILLALSHHERSQSGEEVHKLQNLLPLESFRLRSEYCSKSGVEFWIITEVDLPVTIVLLPEQY